MTIELTGVELLRPTDVARLLKLSRSQVYIMAQRGELPVLRIGHALRIPAAELARWVERQTIPAADEAA